MHQAGRGDPVLERKRVFQPFESEQLARQKGRDLILKFPVESQHAREESREVLLPHKLIKQILKSQKNWQC